MEAVHGWREVPPHLKGASLAIGNFDGVHRGHRAVLSAAKAKAGARGLPMGVMVFEPYPRKFFQPQRPFFRLSSLPRKLELLSARGCGFTAVIPFDETVAELTAAEFVQEILANSFAIKHATVGYNFFFGKNRGGNPAAGEGPRRRWRSTVPSPEICVRASIPSGRQRGTFPRPSIRNTK